MLKQTISVSSLDGMASMQPIGDGSNLQSQGGLTANNL